MHAICQKTEHCIRIMKQMKHIYLKRAYKRLAETRRYEPLTNTLLKYTYVKIVILCIHLYVIFVRQCSNPTEKL